MKILSILSPLRLGGGERLTIDYGLFFKKRSIDFAVLNLTKSKDFENFLTKNNINFFNLTNIELKESPSKKDYLFLFFRLLPYCLKLRKFIKRFNPDVVFSNGFPAMPLLVISLFADKKIKKIYFHHSIKNNEKGIITKIYLSFLKKYHLIIGVSSLTKRTLKEVFPEIENKILALPNPIDLKRFDVKNSKDELRKQLKLPAGILAISVGRLEKFKNQKFLIELAEKIILKEFKILIIGYGKEYEDIKNLIKQKNLEERIILLGYINNKDIPLYLKASDIFLYPSLKEGFGIVILEAMASGLPIVIFKDIYIEEFGKNIFVANNKEEFIKMTEKLIVDENLRKKMGEKVKEDVRNFDIENVGNRLINILTKYNFV